MPDSPLLSSKALVRLLDEAYSARAWHGPTLRGALRGVGWHEAYQQPGVGRHSIRALVLHAAYWKYVARRRIVGLAKGAFPLEGSNWFPGPAAASARQWKADLEVLASEHRRLRDAVEALTPSGQRRPTSKGRVAADEVLGAAYHDVYHAGQIQLIKRLLNQTARA